MSTLPSQDVQSLTCVLTDFLERICRGCGVRFQPRRGNQLYCKRSCQVHNTRDERAKLRVIARNVLFAQLNRDRYISFDGKYEGPRSNCTEIVVTIRKDKGYHAMPIDVHVKPIKPKHAIMTPEDHDWATRQKPFEHTKSMPAPRRNFCAVCVEMIVDPSKKEVRVTQGVYLPIEHKCGVVRVYDIHGRLLEVKQQ